MLARGTGMSIDFDVFVFLENNSVLWKMQQEMIKTSIMNDQWMDKRL